MLQRIRKKFQYGNHLIKLETGFIAKQATSSIIASMGDTSVLITIVVDDKIKLDQNFFPLIVNYQERSYSAGKIPGGFFKREGRPSENEILISRLIDRSVRPLFPKDFLNEVQIIITVISFDPQIYPDIISIIGVSAALGISEIPFKKSIGAAKIGLIDNKYILNPNYDQINKSKLNMVVSSCEDSVLMVESKSDILTEKQILLAIKFGHENQKIVIKNIDSLIKEIGVTKKKYQYKTNNLLLRKDIEKYIKPELKKIFLIKNKKNKNNFISNIKDNCVEKFSNNYELNQFDINLIIEDIEKEIIRKEIINNSKRIDGRHLNDIRNIEAEIGILSRAHGSSLFTRGETQALVSVTLGTDKDAQMLDELNGDKLDYFIMHYNFLPFSVGEIGIIGSPKRREIGHGNLAKNSFLHVIPDNINFPYTIRVVSEITESNGSSSMASVCGTSLALMDAGVPIKTSIAGIAMGLIKHDNKFAILSDILSDEDKYGDMDFKIAGSINGITALQMDIKIKGITLNVINESLKKAKISRINILNTMNDVIKYPKKKLSNFAPKIHLIKIKIDQIKNIIGKGGSIIKSLTESTGATIEINNNGIVKISSTDNKKILNAINLINDIICEIEIGKIYKGKIIKIVNFGVFVSFAGRKEGLVHISKISNKKIDKIENYLKVGQDVFIKVLEIDNQGRLKLSIKDV